MRIFVTGATGFLGQHFLRAALKAGHAVSALRFPGEDVKSEFLMGVKWIAGTLSNPPILELQEIEVLVHLAAHGVNPAKANWTDCFHWNVTASLEFWLAADGAGVRRYVIAGSCFEYGTSGERYDFIPVTAPLLPTGPYHSSKAAATMAALGFSTDKCREVVVLRPFHIYGDGEPPGRFWPDLMTAANGGRDFPMTVGTQIRDFTRVEDVANVFLNAVVRDDLVTGEPRVENVGSGYPRSLLRFAQDEWKRVGATGRLLPGSIPLRDNEVMRYVPELAKVDQIKAQ